MEPGKRWRQLCGSEKSLRTTLEICPWGRYGSQIQTGRDESVRVLAALGMEIHHAVWHIHFLSHNNGMFLQEARKPSVWIQTTRPVPILETAQPFFLRVASFIALSFFCWEGDLE